MPCAFGASMEGKFDRALENRPPQTYRGLSEKLNLWPGYGQRECFGLMTTFLMCSSQTGVKNKHI